MDTLLSFSFWAQGFLFCLSLIIFVWLPGFAVITLSRLNKKFSVLESFVISNAVGTSLLSVCAIIGGYLGFRFVSVLLLGLLDLYIIVKFRRHHQVRLNLKKVVQQQWIVVVFIFLGVLLQVLQTFGSGLTYNGEIRFFRTHAYDGIFHLGLIENSIRSFPPIEPSASGLYVSNYHYFSDVFIAEIARIWNIDVSFLFFQFVPVWTLLLTALGLVILTRRLHSSKTFTYLALLFLFFGADAGYLAYWYIHKTISFTYPVIDNGATQILNMPHVFAKMIMFPILFLVHHWIEKKEYTLGFLTVLLGACLFGFKVYFGIYIGLVFACIGIINAFYLLSKNNQQHRKFFFQLILCGVVFLITTLLIYLPVNRGAGGLSYVPLAWPKLLLEEAHLDWKQWRYKSAIADLTNNTAKRLYYDIQAIVICLLVMYGTRFIGVFVSAQHKKTFGTEFLFALMIPSYVFIFLGMYTLQQSGTFNVFNFFAVSAAILSITLSYSITLFLKRSRIFGSLLLIILMIFTVPRIMYETATMIARYQQKTDMVVLTKSQQEGYRFIQSLPNDAIVQTSPVDQFDTKSTYTTAFGKRQSYMSGAYILETHNQPVADRIRAVSTLFSLDSLEKVKTEAHTLGITHILISTEDKTHVGKTLLSVPERAMFHNDQVYIFAVDSL